MLYYYRKTGEESFMMDRSKCGALFNTFFKIGLFTFGGGYAMISLIEDEVGRRRGWIDGDELAEVFAIAESTPGPIAINCATYVGYRQAGAWGSAAATLGVVLPSFIIICLISAFIEQFMALKAVASAFRGVQAAVALLVLRAGVRLIRRLPKKAYAIAACALSAVAVAGINLLGWSLSTIWLILLGALMGIILLRGEAEGGGEG